MTVIAIVIATFALLVFVRAVFSNTRLSQIRLTLTGMVASLTAFIALWCALIDGSEAPVGIVMLSALMLAEAIMLFRFYLTVRPADKDEGKRLVAMARH